MIWLFSFLLTHRVKDLRDLTAIYLSTYELVDSSNESNRVATMVLE